jgi:hypothetical protein
MLNASTIMNRREAAKSGLFKYWTEKSCKRGHPPLRYTKTGACVGCVAWYSQQKNQVYQEAFSQLRSVTYRLHVDDVEAVNTYVAAINAARALC